MLLNIRNKRPLLQSLQMSVPPTTIHSTSCCSSLFLHMFPKFQSNLTYVWISSHHCQSVTGASSSFYVIYFVKITISMLTWFEYSWKQALLWFHCSFSLFFVCFLIPLFENILRLFFCGSKNDISSQITVCSVKPAYCCFPYFACFIVSTESAGMISFMCCVVS